MESPNHIRSLITIGLTLSALWLGITFQFLIPIGWIGEVTPMWSTIPITNIEEPISCVGNLCLYSTRPLVRCGEFPWMFNIYTASFPDWPQWILYHLFNSPLSIRISQILSTLLLLLGLGYWGSKTLSPLYLITFFGLLLTDWNFLFYKKALGNTEMLLQIAWMSCLLSLVPTTSILTPKNLSRQKQIIFMGIVVGTWSKLPFILHLIPLMFFIWTTQLKRVELTKTICIATCISLLPFALLVAWTIDIDIPVRSHDFWTLQWERIVFAIQGNSSNVREHSHNVWIWLGDPLQFFEQAYGASKIKWHGWGRMIGYLIFGGALFTIRNKTLWSLTGTLIIQIMVLAWVAQDLHHIVIATPLLWYTIVRVSQEAKLSNMLFMVMTAGILGSNIWMLWDAHTIIESVKTPTFSESRQQQLVDLLNKHEVSNLVTMDYEVFGVLEVRSPSLNVLHTWPQISTERWDALPSILEANSGSHLLVLDASMSMTYNLQPSEQRLNKVAKDVGISIKHVGEVDGMWLYLLENPLSTDDSTN